MSSIPGSFLNNVPLINHSIFAVHDARFRYHLGVGSFLSLVAQARVSINRSPIFNGLIRRVPRQVLRTTGPSPIGSRDSVHGIDTRARSEDVSDSVDETDDFPSTTTSPVSLVTTFRTKTDERDGFKAFRDREAAPDAEYRAGFCARGESASEDDRMTTTLT